LSSHTFTTTVIPAGNATGVVVPPQIVEALGAGKRPKVVITIHDHSWRSSIASKGGQFLIGISRANRVAADIAEGANVSVTVKLDTEPRVVEVPKDLETALSASPTARLAFDRLAFGLRRRHVSAIEDARSDETRKRRIARLVEKLSEE